MTLKLVLFIFLSKIPKRQQPCGFIKTLDAMDSQDDFDLEDKLVRLTMNTGDVSALNRMEKDGQLAELIARCCAEFDSSNDNERSDQLDTIMSEKNDPKLPTCLIVTNLPKNLFVEQHLKVMIEQFYFCKASSACILYVKRR